MTHIQNLASILRDGEIRSYNQMRGHTYLNLSNPDVQAGRASITISATGKPLHDYVPLYLGFKTPMVSVNQNHNEDLLFLQFSLDILNSGKVVISDGNARSARTQFKVFSQLVDLDFLDIKAIRALKYAYDSELTRKKQAEILIPDTLKLGQLLYITCYSESAKTRLLAILTESGITVPIQVNPNWFF